MFKDALKSNCAKFLKQNKVKTSLKLFSEFAIIEESEGIEVLNYKLFYSPLQIAWKMQIGR